MSMQIISAATRYEHSLPFVLVASAERYTERNTFSDLAARDPKGF
jgi:hypothetical protein